MNAVPDGLDAAPRRPGLPGSMRTVVSTPRGELQHNAYPATGASNLASTRELQRMAEELRTQNAPTYAGMSVPEIAELLSISGKSLHTLSAGDDEWAQQARGQMALSPQVHPREGDRFPAGTYLFVSQLISNGEAGGLRGGGSHLLNVAKGEVLRSGALGLKLYTDTDDGARFYLKNGFDVLRTEDVGGNTRRHMGWRAPVGDDPGS
jgi:hypothetical protein